MSAAPAMLGLRQIQIKMENGPKKGQIFLLEKSPIFIGREEENDIVFAHDTKMSRRHVEISLEGSKWHIKNLSSKNPLRVNGNEVNEHEISGVTKLQIGESEVSLSLPPPPAPQTQTLDTAKDRHLNAVQPYPQNPVSSPRPPPPTMNRPAVSSGGGVMPPGMPRPQTVNPRPGNRPEKGSNKIMVVIIVLGLVAGAFYLTNSGPLKARRASQIKTQDQVLLNLQKSEDTIKDIETKQEQSGKNGLQFQLAQEQFIKGFRDYRQGQYALAMTAFSAATSLYPNHELAKKYYYLSKRKFDEKVQVYMIQGRRYLGKTNYRLCRSSYESVMIMLKNENDPIYKEAKQFSTECAKKAEGKF